MNIVIISDFNIAGQPTALMRAINKYTDHKARCIIAFDDHFSYDKDIILSPETHEEASQIVKDGDFFHFGRGIFNWPGVEFTNSILNQENCCIKYYGSELRNNYEKVKKFHEETGITAITGTDWSITGRLPNSIYHLGSYFTKFGDTPEKELPMSPSYSREHNPIWGADTFKICAGSAGSPMKGYDFLFNVIQELQGNGYKIELELIQGLSNADCLKKKAECHATFTSLHGAWGISGVESMFLGHGIMSCLDPWIMSMYPNNPTVIINRQNLKDQIMKMMDDTAVFHQRRKDTKTFALENFRTPDILKRYLYLFDLIMNKEAYFEGGKNPETVYNF